MTRIAMRNRWLAGAVALVMALSAAGCAFSETAPAAMPVTELTAATDTPEPTPTGAPPTVLPGETLTDAVVRIAYEAVLDGFAMKAARDKLNDLRKNGANGKKFRNLSMNEVDRLVTEARETGRAEAEALYSPPTVEDPEALTEAVNALAESMAAYKARYDAEWKVYESLYITLLKGVDSWLGMTDAAGEDDDALFSALCAVEPRLALAENALYREPFLRITRSVAESEQRRIAFNEAHPDDPVSPLDPYIFTIDFAEKYFTHSPEANRLLADWDTAGDALLERLLEIMPYADNLGSTGRRTLMGRVEALLLGVTAQGGEAQ